MYSNYFHHFKTDITSIARPQKFTFPFYYTPHELAKIACEQVQRWLTDQTYFKHNFSQIGKMFGVLVVETKQKELGFLAAYSGKLLLDEKPVGFAPFINESFKDSINYQNSNTLINTLSQKIDELENNPDLHSLKMSLIQLTKLQSLEMNDLRQQLKLNKMTRKEKRLQVEMYREEKMKNDLLDKLIKESLHDKFTLNQLKNLQLEQCQLLEKQIMVIENQIEALKEERKHISYQLQLSVFEGYKLKNYHGETKSLIDIFKEHKIDIPPAGAGDCAAPKLLQYAYLNDLKPIAMAEFWWGAPHKSAIRTHGNFYPACMSKCSPILQYMLQGLEVDENPMLVNVGADKKIEILFEDQSLLIINKPSGLLSVPGKNISDSVAERLIHLYPQNEILLVHRLDQETSGIMLVAKDKSTHKSLQKQFINRTIKKRYIALLSKKIDCAKGSISLPLRLDIDNRPSQLVCFENGKESLTQYEVIQSNKAQTLIYFYPQTGRTHQLRVHSAHVQGLNAPIVGDDIYGTKDQRLCLHADRIEFFHPIKKEKMVFELENPFKLIELDN